MPTTVSNDSLFMEYYYYRTGMEKEKNKKKETPPLYGYNDRLSLSHIICCNNNNNIFRRSIFLAH